VTVTSKRGKAVKKVETRKTKGEAKKLETGKAKAKSKGWKGWALVEDESIITEVEPIITEVVVTQEASASNDGLRKSKRKR
jgi:hypothetical protein